MAQLKSTLVQGALTVTGNAVASKLIKNGGTSDDILLGDGSTTSKSALIAMINAAVVLKGTVGTNGTVTKDKFPAASESTLGDAYKVITADTYQGVAAKVGDMLICYHTGSSYDWMLIPSGDDIEDTWREIKVNGTPILANGTTTNALNLKAGTNMTLTNSNGTVTFDATDTGATTVSITGDGNAFTNAEYNASTRTITFTKGSKFLTSHQSLANYVTLNGAQTITGVKTFSAQPVISTTNGLKFDSGNCKLRIYNTSASPTDYAAIEVRSNNTSTNRNLFIDLANNSLVVGAASGTADTTYKVNVKDTFNATTIYENGKSIATQEWVTTQLGSGGSGGSGYIQGSGTTNYIPKFTATGAIGDSILSADDATVTANGSMLLKQYLKINAWSGYGTGSANFWYDGNKKMVAVENMSDLRFGNDGPYATRTVDTLTENTILIGAGTSSDKYKITTSSKTITTTLGSDDTTIPTSKAVSTYVAGLLEDLELGDSYQPLDTDLTAIAGLGDSTTTGLLRKSGKNSWAIDSNTYLKPGDNASANYLAFFKDGDEVSGSQNTHCDGVGNIKAASYGIYTDIANNKTATWQYNSSTDCVELMWN